MIVMSASVLAARRTRKPPVDYRGAIRNQKAIRKAQKKAERGARNV